MIKKYTPFVGLMLLVSVCCAQTVPLKPRPDAFPWQPQPEPKVVNMASSLDQMVDWNRYPTYDTYLDMMARWAERYPNLCSIDTIGRSVQGRLVLAANIYPRDFYPQRPLTPFFYSSTIHGDEVTGFVMMLRLIDTLLNGYGNDTLITNLMLTTHIYINPLANPDGTYHGGNNTLSGAWRYNANGVDLNRNFPDPFGSDPVDPQQQEVTDMINYVVANHFALAANLHGGSEVLNYPWDSFTSSQRTHPNRDWWINVSKRFVDTCRQFSRSYMRDVSESGYIDGGDWYVIPNGRQDYFNYVHHCLEMTMEISTVKKLSSDLLPTYWKYLHRSFLYYIKEAQSLPTQISVDVAPEQLSVHFFPNPARSSVSLSEPLCSSADIFDLQGRKALSVLPGSLSFDVSSLSSGVYLFCYQGSIQKLVIR